MKEKDKTLWKYKMWRSEEITAKHKVEGRMEGQTEWLSGHHRGVSMSYGVQMYSDHMV